MVFFAGLFMSFNFQIKKHEGCLKNMFTGFLTEDFTAKRGAFCSPYQTGTGRKSNEVWLKRPVKKTKDIFKKTSKWL
jgi:hypothetical protein